MHAAKAYKGVPMEGPIATWYTRNTALDRNRFEGTARVIAERVQPGASILEVAPGPGYLAIELAKRGYVVSALDISKSFVRIAQENASKAGVVVDVRHGNASQTPFPDASFDYIVCMAAFKNFTDPVGAINEMHRLLKPGGQASILDLRKDATREELDTEVRNMHLSSLNTRLTRWTFQWMLLRLAYTHEQLQQMAAQSSFGPSDVTSNGVGCELRLTKRS